MGSVNKVFSFVDDAQIKSNQLVANPELEVANRLVYTMPVLQKDTRISGMPNISITGNIDQSVSNLTALLVDYGGAKPEIVTRGWMDAKLKEYRKFNGDSTGQRLYIYMGHAAR